MAAARAAADPAWPRRADPAAQQDRHHDGDLNRGALRRHPGRAQEARPVAWQLGRCCTPVLYGQQKSRLQIATGL